MSAAWALAVAASPAAAPRIRPFSAFIAASIVGGGAEFVGPAVSKRSVGFFPSNCRPTPPSRFDYRIAGVLDRRLQALFTLDLRRGVAKSTPRCGLRVELEAEVALATIHFRVGPDLRHHSATSSEPKT